MQLTPNFSLDELIASDIASRHGINNTPSDEILEDLKKTAELGEAIRAALNEGQLREVFVLVTSGYRCEALERIVCQKDFERWCKRQGIKPDGTAWNIYFRGKAHPKGRSIDIKAPRFGSPRRIANELIRHPEIMARIDQLIEEGDWLHVSWSDNPRGEVKTARFDANGTPTYSKGLS